MVGRPYPIYKPYTGSSKPNDEEKKKKKDADEELDKEIARLEKLKERAEKKAQMRSIKKETFALEHEGIIKATKRGGKAIGRAGKFAGMVGRELVQPIRPRIRKSRTGRTVRLRTSPISVRASQDISLTKAIAQNDWSGSGLMDREFLSDSADRDLLGTTINMDNLVGSNSQKLKKLI